jgi:hypothetical protein
VVERGTASFQSSSTQFTSSAQTNLRNLYNAMKLVCDANSKPISTQGGSTAKKRYRCPHKFEDEPCPGTFEKPSALFRHCIEVHRKYKAYVCSVCKAGFGRSSSFKEHAKTLHAGRRCEVKITGERPDGCSVCKLVRGTTPPPDPLPDRSTGSSNTPTRQYTISKPFSFEERSALQTLNIFFAS